MLFLVEGVVAKDLDPTLITLHNVCAVHGGRGEGKMFSTLGRYHEYTRGIS